MKLTFILLTAAMFNVAANGLSQTVSFNGKNTSLQEVMTAVKKQTGFSIAYTKGLLDKANPISMNVTNLPLKDFLQQVFYNQPLDYFIKNTTIVILHKTNLGSTGDLKTTDGVLALLGIITGRVINEEGLALAGASVMVKGAANLGVSTDANGYYKIENIPQGDYTIIVTYVGYATKTATIKLTEDRAANLDFKLIPSLVNLDQLTVTSTLSARKIRSYPGTLAEIKGKDLQNRNLNNMANVLDAIPGIIVTPGYELFNTGNTRRPVGILIRGTSAGAEIKYLIDGVEVVKEILQTIDPNSFEKIEVLKGPMASTLYGSGGAGGIISITTKKGKSGKSKVNFKTMFTDRSNDYADYKGYQQDYSLNVSGGHEQFNYLLGVAYNLYPITKLTDINNGIDQKTWAYNARVGGKINNIAADLTLQYGVDKAGVGSTDISYNKYRASLGLSQYPVGALTDTRSGQRTFLTSLHLTHTIANNWYQDLTIGYNLVDGINSDYTQDYTGYYSNYESLYSKINARYFMFHDHSWSHTLKTSITAGFEYNAYETRQIGIYTTTPLTNFFTSSTPATADAATFTKSPYSSIGYFAEAVTEFHNNIFLTTGIRYDVNPAYGDNIKSYAQPRVGLSYVIESTNLKIKPRVVWGVSSTAPDPTYKVTSVTPGPYNTYMIIGNTNIKPQRSEGYELGADLFYRSNYSLNITFYDQRIKDMIQPAYGYDFTVTPPVFSTYYSNIGKAINRGLEVSAKAVVEPFTVDLSYTQTVSKWGDEIGQTPDAVVYTGAPNLGIPTRSTFARVSYKVPSFLPWTRKGGNISLDWRYNGSSYNYDDISYTLASDAWNNLPDPKPTPPDQYNYLIWQKGYSFLNLRADYSLTNYAILYVDVQNLLDKQGSINGQSVLQFPGRRINFGFNINF